MYISIAYLNHLIEGITTAIIVDNMQYIIPSCSSITVTRVFEKGSGTVSKFPPMIAGKIGKEVGR